MAETALVPTDQPDTPALRVITYPTTEQSIAQLREKFAGLSPESRDGYEAVRVAIGALRALRTAIELRRKELKADALDYGRKVDDRAKALTKLVADIETPLCDKKQAVDDAKAKQRQQEEEARLDALREELRAKQEADTQRLAEERAALEEERKRLDAERAERDRVEAEARAKREAEEAEARRLREAEEAKLRAEREAIEAERRKLDAERAERDRLERAREAKERADREARERAERERIEAEEARVREAERQAALKARLDALRPDVEKVLDFAETLHAITTPLVTSIEAQEWLNDTMQAIQMAADSLIARAGEGASFS